MYRRQLFVMIPIAGSYTTELETNLLVVGKLKVITPS